MASAFVRASSQLLEVCVSARESAAAVRAVWSVLLDGVLPGDAVHVPHGREECGATAHGGLAHGGDKAQGHEECGVAPHGNLAHGGDTLTAAKHGASDSGSQRAKRVLLEAGHRSSSSSSSGGDGGVLPPAGMQRWDAAWERMVRHASLLLRQHGNARGSADSDGGSDRVDGLACSMAELRTEFFWRDFATWSDVALAGAHKQARR
eukprot:352427-Chlamydomonas_euryale.AAC.7